ncbi:gamma-glutamyl-gamma-aminobutyrate hydrolase family protein [Radiobacillus kanasensis]|uniref:gamma-glutamyl-gamma-aminobutyrate hydrolase family protein n=1 Tax=Radiobacillus kanasensis TaxID=2844358 RepID=UPI001E564E9B|nr:gamma-glutamyl-gamma-aminobutyrate hydrolase family protein [Radiobacillus kanasensis]UFT99158.1 gamma-glutamyl-gamma-aminobutyrate hydrolase family protein [Radiobacillus kanasensis]
MKPIIGITTSIEVENTHVTLSTANVQAITRTGGLPFALANLTNEQDIKAIGDQLDGLYVTGGYDINPFLFGEEPHPNLGTITPARDTFEIALIRYMLEKNKPILAVCRGSQVLNIAAGGDMYQDIYDQINHSLLQHQQKAPKGHASHFVKVKENSLLQQITGKEQLLVNSRHHQANRRIAPGFASVGEATDGVNEAIESQTHRFALGLQWHPENLLEVDDEDSRRIYEAFIQQSKEAKHEAL